MLVRSHVFEYGLVRAAQINLLLCIKTWHIWPFRFLNSNQFVAYAYITQIVVLTFERAYTSEADSRVGLLDNIYAPRAVTSVSYRPDSVDESFVGFTGYYEPACYIL